MLGVGCKCSSRELNSTMMLNLTFSSRGKNFQEKNNKLVSTGHAWVGCGIPKKKTVAYYRTCLSWLQIATAVSLNSKMVLSSSFVSRGRNSQEINHQFLITGLA